MAPMFFDTRQRAAYRNHGNRLKPSVTLSGVEAAGSGLYSCCFEKVWVRLSIIDNPLDTLRQWLHGEASAGVASRGFVSRHLARKPKTEELFDGSESEQPIGVTVRRDGVFVSRARGDK